MKRKKGGREKYVAGMGDTVRGREIIKKKERRNLSLIIKGSRSELKRLKREEDKLLEMEKKGGSD